MDTFFELGRALIPIIGMGATFLLKKHTDLNQEKEARIIIEMALHRIVEASKKVYLKNEGSENYDWDEISSEIAKTSENYLKTTVPKSLKTLKVDEQNLKMLTETAAKKSLELPGELNSLREPEKYRSILPKPIMRIPDQTSD